MKPTLKSTDGDYLAIYNLQCLIYRILNSFLNFRFTLNTQHTVF